MSANFNVELGTYTDLKPFRFWCQKVLPLVYDDSLSYYELLCKVVDYLNKTMEDVETLHTDVEGLNSAFIQLQNYVNTYFDNLDVQTEVNKKLDQMAADGTLSNLITTYHNVICVGDSYGVGSGSFFQIFANLMGLSAERFHNLSVSGTGFDRSGVNGFLTQLQNYTGDRLAITDIIVCGGANDAEGRAQSNQGTLIAGIAYFASYARANFPNAKLYIGFVGGCLSTSEYFSNRNADNMMWALFCYKNRSAELGMTYLNNIEYAIKTTVDNYGSDGLHPNTNGQNSIGRALYEAFNKTYEVFFPPQQTIPNSNVTILGDICSFEIGGTFNVGAFNGNTTVPLGTMPWFSVNKEVRYPINFVILTASKPYINGTGYLKINGKDISLVSMKINESNNGYENYPDATGVILDKTTLIIPTLFVN